MPYEIQNDDLYEGSTRFVRDWHRATFGKRAKMVDLDGVGYCPDCKEILYVVEGTSNPEKTVWLCRKVAHALSVPAIVVRHDAALTMVLRVTNLDTGATGDEEYGKDLLGGIRERHWEICPNHPGERA